MSASLVPDTYGLVGFPQQPVTAFRLAGAVFIVTSVLLIQRR